MLRRTVALTLALASGLAAAGAAPPSPIDLLHAAAEAPRHVSYVGQVELLGMGATGSEASVFRVEHLAPDLTRRTYLAPSNLYGDWQMSNGSVTYAVDVRRRNVVTTPNETFGVHYGWYRNLSLLLRNYRTVAQPDADIAGRPVHVIALVNRYTGRQTMRVWIDAKTDMMLQRQVYSSNGSIVTQMRFEEIRFTRAIPSATFALPGGYASVAGQSRGDPGDPREVMAKAGFAVHAPHYLPEGFQPVAADVAEVNGVRTLHLLYSDGIRTISLFENAKGAAVDMSGYRTVAVNVGSRRGEEVERGPTTLLAWADDTLHLALVGDLNRDELQRIAASISP